MKALFACTLLAIPLVLFAEGQSDRKSMPQTNEVETPTFGGSSTMQGKKVMLEGTMPNVGEPSPDFQLTDGKLKQTDLADLGPGKKILNIVTSLDTSVCQEQTRRFAQEIASLPGYSLVTISADLPFAQQRWAKEAGIDGSSFYSDYRDSSFGRAYGLQVHEFQLLNRALIILDENNKVRYVQKVDEITDHPDYEAVLQAARTI